MNRRDLCVKILDRLREQNYRKHVTASKTVFTISDNSGNKKDFVVKHAEKNLLLNLSDVEAVIEAMVECIKEATTVGEPVVFRGFGAFGLKYRKPRATLIPGTKIWSTSKGRWIPNFKFGAQLAECAHKYGLISGVIPDDDTNGYTDEDTEDNDDQIDGD